MKSKYIFILSVLFLSFMVTPSHAGWLIYHKPEFRGKIIDADTKQPIEGALVVAVYKSDQIFSLIPYQRHTVNIKEVFTDNNGNFSIPSYMTLISPFTAEGYVDLRIYKFGYKKKAYFQIWALSDGLAFSVNNLSANVIKRIDEYRKLEFEKLCKANPDWKCGERRFMSDTESDLKFFLPFVPLDKSADKLAKLDIPFFTLPDDVNCSNIKWIDHKFGTHESSMFTVFGLAKAKTRDERLLNLPGLEDPDEYDFLDNLTNFARVLNEENAALGLPKYDLYKAGEVTQGTRAYKKMHSH